jgi:hypothetical protein
MFARERERMEACGGMDEGGWGRWEDMKGVGERAR